MSTSSTQFDFVSIINWNLSVEYNEQGTAHTKQNQEVDPKEKFKSRYKEKLIKG